MEGLEFSGMTPPERRPQAPILIVEDHEDVRGGLLSMLQAHGYWTISAKHGQEALALLRSGPRPALILLDLLMPVMDGWEFRQEQLKDPALADIPVVILSSYVERFTEGDRRTLGIPVVLPKPVLPDDLLAAVERYAGVLTDRGNERGAQGTKGVAGP
jgi:CheY-like chemotaxis protein